MCINVPILSKRCEWVVHTNVPILSKWCEWVVHTNVPILSKWCEWVVHTNVPILSKWCEWVVHTNVPILSKQCEWVVHTNVPILSKRCEWVVVQMYLYSVSGVNELYIWYCLFVNDILHCRCFIRLWNNLSFASNWVQFRHFMGPCYLFYFFCCCWVLFYPRPVSCVQCCLCLWIVHS
jgi:hypothetical protein